MTESNLTKPTYADIAEDVKEAGASRLTDCKIWLLVGEQMGELNSNRGLKRQADPLYGPRFKPSCNWMTGDFAKNLIQAKCYSEEEVKRLAFEYGVPFFTSTLDHALLMLPKGWEWLRKSPETMTVYKPTKNEKDFATHYEAPGNDPALALVAAICCALSIQKGNAE